MDGQPSVMRIDRVADETDQLRLFTLIPEDEWAFIPGQVAVLGLEGVGESYFAIASAPEDKEILEVLVKDGEGVARPSIDSRRVTVCGSRARLAKAFR